MKYSIDKIFDIVNDYVVTRAKLESMSTNDPARARFEKSKEYTAAEEKFKDLLSDMVLNAKPTRYGGTNYVDPQDL